MKKFYVVILFLILNISLKSQKISVEWSNESKAKNGMDPKKILGEWGGEIYLLKDDYSSAGKHHYYSLETYSASDLLLTNSTELKLPDIHQRGDLKMISLTLMKNGNLVLFFDNEKTKLAKPYSKIEEKEYTCYASLIDKKGKSITEPQLIYEDLQSYKADKDYIVKKCGVVLNTDSTKFFMYSSNVKNKKIVGKLFDADLNNIKTISFEVPSAKSFAISNLILDEKQILFAISKENTPEPKKYSYKVLALNLITNDFKSTPIDVKTSFPLSRFHMIKTNNKLQIVGYYFNGMKKKATGGGVIYYEFSANSLENKKSFENEYDIKVIAQLNSNSKFLKEYTMYDTVNAITSLVNTKIINLKDDEMMVVSEQIVELELANTTGDDYFNIIVTRINKNGIINQPYVIPKLQSGKSKSFYSYIDIVKDNKLYLIFNDNSRNDGLEDPYKIEGGLGKITGSTPFLIRLAEAGVWTKKTLYSVDESTTYIHPSKFYYKTPNEILIYGQKENKIKFALIKL
jgi:hypothetical protein